MAYTEFVNYLTYQKGSVVSYRGAVFVFTTTHNPGSWDYSQVLQIEPVSYSNVVAPKSNILPDYNLSRPLPSSKFRIVYNQNNDYVNTVGNFTQDTQVYSPGESVFIKGYPNTHISSDGLWAYSFQGWNLEKGTGVLTNFEAPESFVHYLEEDTEYIMPDHDLVLYAQWSKTPTITVDIDGRVMLKEEYKQAEISNLTIPEYFEGRRTKIIGTGAFSGSNTACITIPASITTVESNALSGWVGHTIKFIDVEVTVKYPSLHLNTGCFASTPNLVEVILPYRWRSASGIIFPVVPNKTMRILVRNTKNFMTPLLKPYGYVPAFDAESYIAADSDPSNGINYSRSIYWGWND